jgi:hypothetical protein
MNCINAKMTITPTGYHKESLVAKETTAGCVLS